MTRHQRRFRVTTVLTTVLCVLGGCRQPRRDTPAEALSRAWSAYKDDFVHADGYVLDPERNGGEVTSEGQGYALLRAAWMRDAAGFSQVFTWTEQNLRRRDGLYSWRWSPDGGGCLLDGNTASDADQEIAFALIIASAAFSQPAYLTRTRELLQAIRTHEALKTGRRWFPAAGNWAVDERIVNLSYFLPYAYPYFARVDPEGLWNQVTDAGYDLIASGLGMDRTDLIPDFSIATAGGTSAPLPSGVTLSRDFSSDAMRIFWRVAVDCRLHQQMRACADPLHVSQLTTLLARDGALYTRYGLDGSPQERTESISFYGTALPYLLMNAPATAQAVRAARLGPAVLDGLAGDRKRYYDANWVWFGLAASDGVVVERTPPVNAIELPWALSPEG